MAHKSTFDDLAFLDPLQSHQSTQATTLTPAPSQTEPTAAQTLLQKPHLPNTTSSTSTPSIQEQNVDKFATLFSPSTPRGSPVTNPLTSLPDQGAVLDTATRIKSHTNTHRRTESDSSEQSDFGVFVSVPSSEDPLSLSVDIAGFEEHGLSSQTPNTAIAAAHSAVSLPAADDKDAQKSATTPRFALPPPPPTGARPASRASSASSTSRSTRGSSSQINSTLSFFDQFAQDARERSSATRSLLLDELLLHQDDPLYFLKDQQMDNDPLDDITTPSAERLLSPPLIPLPASGPSSTSPTPPLVTPNLPDQPQLPPTLSPLPVPPPAMSSSPQPPHSLLDLDLNADLDHDYFRVPPPQANLTTPFKHANSKTIILLPRSPPLRSSSIPLPVATLAPPVESPEGVMRLEAERSSRSPPAAAHLMDVSHHLTTTGTGVDDLPDMTATHHHHDSDHHEEGTSSSPSSTSSRLSLPARSSSYHSLSGSLSSLPGKWMSTLLRGPQPPTTPALDSIFSAGSEASRSTAPASDPTLLRPHAHSPPRHDASLTRRNSASTSPQRRRNTQSEHRQQPTFTHTSAFAPPPPTASMLLSGVSHGASPFAPHVYVPPSGAPGFKGERYTWDKGFSAELEAEAEHEKEQRQRGVEGHTSDAANANGTVRDVRKDPVKAKTVPGVGKENNNNNTQREDLGASSSKLGSGSGWGSGFGFSFGSVRAGKGKVGPGAGSGSGSHSNSGSGAAPTSGLSPSSSGMPSTSTSTSAPNGNTNGRTRTPSAHSAESGLSDGSWNAHAHEHERGRAIPSRAGAGEMGSLNADDDGRGRHAELSGMGATNRLVGSREQDSRRTAGGDEPGGGGKDGIGAFIERKSGNVELKGRRAATTPVLTPELAGMIRPYLPALSRLPRSWTLIYSLDQDGISLNTLYTRCEAHVTRRPAPGEVMMNNSAMLIVVRDAEGGTFGVWLAEGVRLNKGGRGYFGGGESFLWKYNDDKLKVFKGTGKNSYIALCEPEYISFGGGDGHYGLYLDDTLFDGSSAPCPTFDNEPLCSPGPRKGASVTFECVGLEVWGMGP